MPPISLPTREFMERAKEIWDELGYPPLQPEEPWSRDRNIIPDEWPAEVEEEAALAVAGRYYGDGREARRPIGGPRMTNHLTR